MRALVTGGAGFIGSHIVELLLRENHEVTVIDNEFTGRKDNLSHLIDDPRLDYKNLDISQYEAIQPLFHGVDWVFHLAALADIVPSIQRPLDYHKSNVDGTVNVLEASRKNKVKKLVYSASSSCYGLAEEIPTTENAKISPQYPYALTKYLGEQYIQHWNKVYSLPTVSLRLFNVYGPRCDDLGQGRVIPIFLEKFLKNQPLIVHGDGAQTRCFTFIEDASEAVVELALNDKALGLCFNIGSDRETSILELAETMKKVGGFDNPIEFKPHVEVFGKSYEDIPRRIPDVGRIKEVLGWEATTGLEDGLAKTIDFYRKP